MSFSISDQENDLPSPLHITPGRLRRLAPSAKLEIVRKIADPLNIWLPEYQISTQKRVSSFLAQAAHETAHFQTLSEYGSGDGPDADQWDDYLTRLYDRRTDLGNTPELDGDGEFYRGRGIFQLTGRYNYMVYGDRLGVPLETQPELAAEGEVSVRIACMFWDDRHLNTLADAAKNREITKAINGGYNGIKNRLEYYDRAIGIDWFAA